MARAGVRWGGGRGAGGTNTLAGHYLLYHEYFHQLHHEKAEVIATKQLTAQP